MAERRDDRFKKDSKVKTVLIGMTAAAG